MKRAKFNAPKKIKGGTVVGKTGEIWFAVKCSNFNGTECKSFKKYIASACKEFFEDEEEEEKEEKYEE